MSNEDSRFKDEIEKLKLVEIDVMPKNLYWRKDAIQFNAEISKENTFVRKLNDDELEHFIGEQYKPFNNGLYRFSKIPGDEKHSFYVTKEELKKYLLDSLLLATIVFKQKILVDKEGTLLLIKQK